MSDKFKRRRSRSGSAPLRFKPTQAVPAGNANRVRIGKAEIAACAAVTVVALALCALIWIMAVHAVQDERAEIVDRAEHDLAGQAATIAETIGHELLLVDQSLTLLQAAWKEDSDSVNLDKLKERMPALTEVADDLFICDEKHVIRQDILPQAVGQGVGAAYVTFPHGSLESFQSDGTKDKESLLLQGQTGAPIDARQFLMYIIRPLDHPRGWLIGASFRSAEITKLFSGAALGFDPIVALVDARKGSVQAVVGPSARRPKLDLSRTPLYSVMSRNQQGNWTGATSVDGVERIHAFHRVANRDMIVLVGAALSEVLAPADALAAGARTLAAVGTALVLLIGALVLWELYTLRAHRRRQRVLERNRLELERLRTEDATTSARARINAARLQVVLSNTSDGVALFDSSLRLVQWNQPFLYGIGIELRTDMPLDTLLREQLLAGMFGPLADVEAEVARRSGILRSGDREGLPQHGPNGEALALRGLPVSEGGFMLLLNGLPVREEAALPVSPDKSAEAAPPQPAAPAPVAW